MIELAMPSVWDIIDTELRRRKKSGAWLGEQLGIKSPRQTINGWKNRGVPAARHQEIADLFGWTLDRLTTGEDPPEAASQQAAPDYSPQALHLARLFDEIPSNDVKMRVYWKVTQLIATGDVPPWTADAPTPPEPSTAAPVPHSISGPRLVK